MVQRCLVTRLQTAKQFRQSHASQLPASLVRPAGVESGVANEAEAQTRVRFQFVRQFLGSRGIKALIGELENAAVESGVKPEHISCYLFCGSGARVGSCHPVHERNLTKAAGVVVAAFTQQDGQNSFGREILPER
jgi:hypothetical protein